MAIDFIYTDRNFNELGYLENTSIDIEIGKYASSKNDFELTQSSLNYDIEFKEDCLFYCEDSEWGGIVENKKSDTSKSTITFIGKTFRGILEKEYIQPPINQSYYIAKGEANLIISKLIEGRFSNLFVVDNVGLSDIKVDYKIRDLNLLFCLDKILLNADIPSRLDIKFYEGKVHIQALPIVDLSELLQYDNSYGLSMIAQTASKAYNHILCLGKGELVERLRVNLYLKKNGEWSTLEKDSYYKGIERKSYIYENTNCEDSSLLIEDAISKIVEINGSDSLSISFKSDNAELFDIVGSKEEITNIEFKEQITSKILKGTLNGALTNLDISYKVGD